MLVADCLKFDVLIPWDAIPKLHCREFVLNFESLITEDRHLLEVRRRLLRLRRGWRSGRSRVVFLLRQVRRLWQSRRDLPFWFRTRLVRGWKWCLNVSWVFWWTLRFLLLFLFLWVLKIQTHALILVDLRFAGTVLDLILFCVDFCFACSMLDLVDPVLAGTTLDLRLFLQFHIDFASLPPIL